MQAERYEFLKTLNPSQSHATGLVRRFGQCSRQEIGDAFQWRSPAVSKVIKPLLDAGLLQSEAIARPDRGRPHDRIEMNPDFLYAIGVSLGFTRLSLALIDLGGRIIAPQPGFAGQRTGTRANH